MAENGNGKIAIDFIDPLFAVVLNVSFAQIFTEAWFQDWRLIAHEPTIFYIVTLLLAYLTVILSWVGYHQSVKRCQISVNSFAGRARFYLDVLLLISYLILLVSYKNFRREITVIVIVFLLYWAWDQFKRIECPERDVESAARRGVTVFWLIFFALLAFGYQVHPPTKAQGCEDWLIALSAITGTILYRWHKKYLWLRWLLLRLGFPETHA